MVLSIPSASMIRAAISVRQVWTRGLGDYDRQFFQFVLLRTVSITVATPIFAVHQALGEVADGLAGIRVTAARPTRHFFASAQFLRPYMPAADRGVGVPRCRRCRALRRSGSVGLLRSVSSRRHDTTTETPLSRRNGKPPRDDNCGPRDHSQLAWLQFVPICAILAIHQV
jgi:hypothetical protein